MYMMSSSRKRSFVVFNETYEALERASPAKKNKTLRNSEVGPGPTSSKSLSLRNSRLETNQGENDQKMFALLSLDKDLGEENISIFEERKFAASNAVFSEEPPNGFSTALEQGIEIFPGIILGNSILASDYVQLRRLRVRSIVNCTKGTRNFFENITSLPSDGQEKDKHTYLPPPPPSEQPYILIKEEDQEGAAKERLEIHTSEKESTTFQYLRVPVDDSAEEIIMKHFHPAADFIEENLDRIDLKHPNTRDCVLVHCRMGQSRSPTIVLAYAMIKLGKSLSDAFQTLSSIHPKLGINDGFKNQLMKFERSFFYLDQPSLNFFPESKRTRTPVKRYDPSPPQRFLKRVALSSIEPNLKKIAGGRL